MAKAADHPSNLFRSLRPDDDDFQTSTSTAAREAEQRWPLFQAVAPRKPQATPLLSPQERSLWSEYDAKTKRIRAQTSFISTRNRQ